MPYAHWGAIPGPTDKYKRIRGKYRQLLRLGGAFRAVAHATLALMRIETRAVHAGRHVDPATGAVTAPIHLSTTFERAPDGGYPLGFSYSREGNPNRAMLEKCLADLEGGKEA